MNTEALCNDFLWYSYFGAPKDRLSSKENALPLLINRAFQDTPRSFKYTYSNSELDTMKKNSNSERDEAEQFELLKERFRKSHADQDQRKTFYNQNCGINCLIKSKNEETFDKCHEELCNELVFSASEFETDNGTKLFKDGGFTYGHAQKWVNMTIKYMLMTGRWPEEFERILMFLHVPIDGYIIKAAKADSSKPILRGCNVKGLGMVVRKLGKWSNISKYCQYFDFQKKVRDLTKKQDLTPIEWEAQAWIAQAMKEARKS